MKIQTKIILVSTVLVVLAAAACLATLLWQRKPLEKRLEVLVNKQALDEVSKIAQVIYWNCEGAEKQYQGRLTHNLGIAKEVLKREGPVTLDTNTVEWTAVNQLTKEAKTVQLPKLLLNGKWLGQNNSPAQPSLVVDELRHLTLGHCTIFQRLNDDGDMLRVSTSVVGSNGNRAIGTYISTKNADGTVNLVLDAVLKGQNYRGRAFVVNEYHLAEYEPIWDAAKSRIIGMLYVGIGMGDINKELHDSITKITLGKSGYAYVLGGKGEHKGKYIVSHNGQRDGESLWEAKDAAGRLVIQAIVGKALQTANGACTNEVYSWKNAGDAKAREKVVAITYFAPWDWVIGAGVYRDDYQATLTEANSAIGTMAKWTVVVTLIVGLIGFFISYYLSIGITRPIEHAIQQLKLGADQTTNAAGQVSSASQTLAEGASEQASSLEETSSSLEEMSSMTKRNADNAKLASELAKQTRSVADKGTGDMQAMSSAMNTIKASSDDIAKIIKTIDEIAFQTNILALNAAVEAARAGEAGMGFAVVADEVRSLAQRSATAAKETAAKIEGAIGNTTRGVALSNQVAATLNDIVAKAREMDDLVAEVAGASREQTQGISQINAAVSQVDKVTQSNAASAEESAAAAQELSAQAATMNQVVNELVALVAGQNQMPATPNAAVRNQARPVQSTASKAKRSFPTASNGHAHAASEQANGSHRNEIPMTGDFKDF